MRTPATSRYSRLRILPKSKTCHLLSQTALRQRLHPVGVQAFFKNIFPAANNSTTIHQEDTIGNELKQWLINQHNMKSSLSSALLPGQGRGLIADKTINKGDVALSIPFDCIITPETALQQSSFRKVLLALREEENKNLPDWSLLALWLAEALVEQNSESKNYTLAHSYYIKTLPSRTGCVLEWTQDEVSLLQGSYLHSYAIGILTAYEASVNELEDTVLKAAVGGSTAACDDGNTLQLIAERIFSSTRGGRGSSAENYLRMAFSLLLSRLVRLDNVSSSDNQEGQAGNKQSTTVEALVMWADLVNHQCDVQEFLHWDQSTKSVVLKADRRIAPGEQCFASYGQKPNGQLLISYGFVPEEGSNPYDACLLEISIVSLQNSKSNTITKKKANDDFKIAVLEQRGIPLQYVFPITLVGLPRGFIRFAAYAAADVENELQAQELCDVLFGSTAASSFKKAETVSIADLLDDGSIPDIALYIQGLEYALKACRSRLNAYKMSLSDVQSELDKLASVCLSAGDSANIDDIEKHVQQRRRQSILKVLLTEQRILNRTIFILQTEIKQQRKRLKK